MGGELRDRIGERQRELASRHDVLVREDAGAARHDDLLRRVFDATNDLIAVLDEASERATRRRQTWAFVLLGLALSLAGLAGWASLQPELRPELGPELGPWLGPELRPWLGLRPWLPPELGPWLPAGWLIVGALIAVGVAVLLLASPRTAAQGGGDE